MSSKQHISATVLPGAVCVKGAFLFSKISKINVKGWKFLSKVHRSASVTRGRTRQPNSSTNGKQVQIVSGTLNAGPAPLT